MGYHVAADPTAAIDEAQELAGQRTIAANAGDVGSQISRTPENTTPTTSRQ